MHLTRLVPRPDVELQVDAPESNISEFQQKAQDLYDPTDYDIITLKSVLEDEDDVIEESQLKEVNLGLQ